MPDKMPEGQEITEIFQFFPGDKLVFQSQCQYFLVIAAGIG